MGNDFSADEVRALIASVVSSQRRERLAGAALQGLLANVGDLARLPSVAYLVGISINIADALAAGLERDEK